MKKEFLELLLVMLVALPVCVGLTFLYGWVVQLVWNKLLVGAVTILTPISYWRAYFLTLAIFYPVCVDNYYNKHKK